MWPGVSGAGLYTQFTLIVMMFYRYSTPNPDGDVPEPVGETTNQPDV
jgi:hypothetical protein